MKQVKILSHTKNEKDFGYAETLIIKENCITYSKEYGINKVKYKGESLVKVKYSDYSWKVIADKHVLESTITTISEILSSYDRKEESKHQYDGETIEINIVGKENEDNFHISLVYEPKFKEVLSKMVELLLPKEIKVPEFLQIK